MKLINYKRGYNNTFNCSIHGTIKMTRVEFDQFYRHIRNNRELLDKYNSEFYWKIFNEDIKRAINTKDSQIINVRVPATEELARHFHLRGYKKGNYQLEII